jgi:hypothetical protein
MLDTTDRPIENVIAFLARAGVEAGYLVPTLTGLEKSILDAHGGLRDYFRITGFHDYKTQAQGVDGKRVAQGFFVTTGGFEKTQISLYRPDTKTGDPRIWIYGLKDRVQPGNLLAILVHGGVLYIFNASDRALLSDQGAMHPSLDGLIDSIAASANLVATELLDRLKAVASNGWVQSLRVGPTGVGYTLETLLGIAANNNKEPDFKGIEIKSSRKGLATRSTLFSKTPDWGRSSVPNGIGLLDAYGYRNDAGRLQLYCSLKNVPNSLGHFLAVQDDDLILHAMHQQPGAETKPDKVLLWDMDILRTSLAEKHKETFWVKVKVKRDDHGEELFLFSDVVHTKGPLLGNMVELFRLGKIECDYLIHEVVKRNRRSARDHGYLFKMDPRNLDSLFPPSKNYSLL